MFKIAIIGAGSGEAVGDHSMGYAHAYTYWENDACQVVGAADISRENLDRFASTFNIESAREDYREMLQEVRPDIVSICTYVGLHRDMVEASVGAGVKGIWCEKPFALCMDDARFMVDLCEARGVRLVVNHQRRYLDAFQEAKRLLRSGMIGDTVAFFAGLPDWDLMEWGTHWLDMFRFFADDQPVPWVMGQTRCTGGRRMFGHAMEERSLAYFSFADGTRGFLDGGLGFNGDFSIRLVGTDGMLDLYNDGSLRVLNESGWQVLRPMSSLHGGLPKEELRSTVTPESLQFLSGEIVPMQAVLSALLTWIGGGDEPEVSGRNALLSTELYLAAYESSLRHDQIELPLVGQARFPLDELSSRYECDG